MESYNEIVKEITYLRDQRDNSSDDMFNQRNVKSKYQVVNDKYRIKNRISNYLCRNIICGIQLTNKNRFVATVFHSNGKFRHYFYFCSIRCYNTFRAFCGLNVPIITGQLTLQ